LQTLDVLPTPLGAAQACGSRHTIKQNTLHLHEPACFRQPVNHLRCQSTTTTDYGHRAKLPATFIENEHCNVSFYSSICLLALMDHDCFVIVFPSLRSSMKQHVAAAKLAPMLTTNCRPHSDPLQIAHHSSSHHFVCFIPCF
jgi:hypothetical protein